MSSRQNKCQNKLFFWKHHFFCFHYWEFWRNNWRSIFDVVERLCLSSYTLPHFINFGNQFFNMLFYFLISKKIYYRLRPIVKLKKRQLLATTKKWNWKFSNKKPGKIKPPWPVRKSKNIWQILFWPKNVKRPLPFPWAISKWYPPLETRPRPTTPSCGKRLQNPTCWKWNMGKELGRTVSLRHIRGHLDYAINQLFLKMKSKADHFRYVHSTYNRVGKTGFLGPWSRVIMYCSKLFFCQNDSPIRVSFWQKGSLLQ